MKEETVAQAAASASIKASPGIAISATSTVFGVQLDAWVVILTGLYLLVQMGVLVYDRVWGKKKGGRK
jgi:hypothetical protein